MQTREVLKLSWRQRFGNEIFFSRKFCLSLQDYLHWLLFSSQNFNKTSRQTRPVYSYIKTRIIAFDKGGCQPNPSVSVTMLVFLCGARRKSREFGYPIVLSGANSREGTGLYFGLAFMSPSESRVRGKIVL